MSSELSQDIEQPGDLPDIPRPNPMPGGRTMTGGTDNTRRSVVFHKDDIDQCIPSLPIEELKDELRNRYGKEVYESDFKACVETADSNGDGLISIPELVHVMEMMRLTEQQNSGLKKVVMLGGVALLFVLLSIFGLVFAVVKLTQEISTGTENNSNALASSATGLIVDTHPDNGGGIYMDMAAFTEPLNITFPGFGTTQECVGQIPVDFINVNYNKFTTGGSSMTIRYTDYSQDAQPVVFTTIPGDTLSVSGFAVDSSAGLLAAQGTEGIRESQVIVDTNGRSRRMAEATRHLQLIMEGAKQVGSQAEEDKRERNDPAPTNSTLISNGKSNTVSFGKGTNRRLQQGEDLLTVDDYMEAFADKSIVLTLTKDTSLTEDVYFVCRDAQVVAVN